MDLKSKIFSTARELCLYAADGANSVVTIVQIVTDNNGKFIIFYLEA